MTGVEAAPATQSRREAGKARRRASIVAAAAALVREAGFEDVSMLDIAARAEVSPATLYNLFATKGAIFREVFDQDLTRFTARVSEAPAEGGVDKIFVALEIAAGLYRRNPKFYRAMMHLGDVEPLNASISEPRRRFWEDCVAAAVSAGELRAGVDARVVGGLLNQIVRGHLLDWAAGTISVDRLAKESAYGFAVVLSAFAAKAAAGGLHARMDHLEKALAGTSGARRK